MARLAALVVPCLWSIEALATCYSGDPPLYTYNGTAYADTIIVCRDTTNGGTINQVKIARCTSSLSSSWIVDGDPCDEYGTVQQPVRIYGGGGNDIIKTIDLSMSLTHPVCGNITCWSGTVFDYYLSLYGDAGNDLLTSGNNTGLIGFSGDANSDGLYHTGTYDNNWYDGGADADTLEDSGGNYEDLWGQDGADCLYTNHGYETFICGGGTDDWHYGCISSCPSPDASCENSVSSCPARP